MAAYTAENKLSGFSPSVTASELDALVAGKQVLFVDVRDVFAFEKNHVQGAKHMPLELLASQTGELPKDRMVIVLDETGKKAHQALRTLVGAGFTNVVNVSGGYLSLLRQARAVGFENIKLDTLPVELKSINEEGKKEEQVEAKQPLNDGPIVVDVRTPGEFRSGAVPGAVNIPLDEMERRYVELGKNPSRDITVYCASGARSAYAQMFLQQLGFGNVTNGGGLSAMMARHAKSNEQPKAEPTEPLVIDVRTPQEFRGGAYPGAVNIPLDELPAHFTKLGSKQREIIVYCASGARSSYAERMMKQAGFSNVRNGGGIMQMMSPRR
jgi:rhodanese-related sulfurtransferase